MTKEIKKEEKKSVRIALKITPSLFSKIIKIAEHNQMDVSKVVRAAIESLVEEDIDEADDKEGRYGLPSYLTENGVSSVFQDAIYDWIKDLIDSGEIYNRIK